MFEIKQSINQIIEIDTHRRNQDEDDGEFVSGIPQPSPSPNVDTHRVPEGAGTNILYMREEVRRQREGIKI